MLFKLDNFFMILMIAAGTFLLTRYVFLEPGMAPGKQRCFYICSFLIIIASFFLLDENAAQLVTLLLGGLNIALGRKRRRILGFLLIIPLVGVVNGIFSPFVLIKLLAEENALVLYITLGMYLAMTALLIVFYYKGKRWRSWFATNMVNRKPLSSEYAIICASGFFMFAGSYALSTINFEWIPTVYESTIRMPIIFYEASAFLLTVTIVTLIMQGNHRKFYHDGLSNMQFNVIATMADIVENRDANTGGHIKRTAKYVEIIGRKLRKQGAFHETLTDQYLTDMIVAAPLHDIGKICIPDAILNKPGRLTEEEFSIMKTHTTAGHDVLLKAEEQLGKFNYLQVALDMAQYHHEWWNGNGYPAGSSGNAIPLCARIMAVADVFDALTAKRCYKDALPPEKAYGIIRAETGTHFDPAVAEAFLSSVAEVEQALSEIPPDPPLRSIA